VPVGKLPYTLKMIGELSRQHGLEVANVFHAGDGNMHPLILFNANKPGDLEKAEAFGADILRLCVEVGGCLTGEHGVGIEKRDLMTTQYDPADLAIQMEVKDLFRPAMAVERRQGVSVAGQPAPSRKGRRRMNTDPALPPRPRPNWPN
jgi:glycolate oxidase